MSMTHGERVLSRARSLMVNKGYCWSKAIDLAAQTIGDTAMATTLPNHQQAARDAAQDATQAPTVAAEIWQDETGTTYTDYMAGEGLTRVLVGSYGGDKAGVELSIGGHSLNEGLAQVITLADVRQLRDNLGAILCDARVQAHLAGRARKPRTERVQPSYNDAGDPCCPKHRKPLREGKFGLFCPAKDDTTEHGYCALKFDA